MEGFKISTNMLQEQFSWEKYLLHMATTQTFSLFEYMVDGTV